MTRGGKQASEPASQGCRAWGAEDSENKQLCSQSLNSHPFGIQTARENSSQMILLQGPSVPPPCPQMACLQSEV